jgi:dTDP-4-dehydrorhamnose 3,5-epimerase
MTAPTSDTTATANLPAGVALRPITLYRDNRGAFAELFREMWGTGVQPKQWNLMDSEAEVVRGVHVHVKHDDYLVVVRGRALIGLSDLRRGSPTEGTAVLLDMNGDDPAGLTIPPGVAHGLYFPEPCLVMLAVSEYWDPEDELGCQWTDPALGIPWPVTTARLSDRDASSPPLSEVLPLVPPYQSS